MPYCLNLGSIARFAIRIFGSATMHNNNEFLEKSKSQQKLEEWWTSDRDRFRECDPQVEAQNQVTRI